MGKAQAIRLIAEGKTGEALGCLLGRALSEECSDKTLLLDKDLKLVYLSNQFHMAYAAFLSSVIKYEEFVATVNKVTLALLDLLKSGDYA